MLIGALIALPLGGYVLFSSRGIVSRIELEWEKHKLLSNIETMKMQQDSLKAVIKRLETDTLLIEKLARERYGMTKPGEHVFIIEQSNKR